MADVLTTRGRRQSEPGHVVATGFTPLDETLGGGLRAGELTLLGGPQGLGKTTMAVQVARNVCDGGGSALYFSFEHDENGLLARLLVQEAFLAAGVAAAPYSSVLPAMERAGGLTELLASAPGMEHAAKQIGAAGKRFVVHPSSGRSTNLDVIRQIVLDSVSGGNRPLVVVDYLQKVNAPAHLVESERVTLIVEGLKDLALEASVPVLAIVAATQEGIEPGQRLRVHHLRGSSALAYEADVILLLNEKYDIVARHHIAYDLRSSERFRQVAVCSVEKNRSGRDHVDMEFRKEFEYCRYDQNGNLVQEQLVDERATVV